MSDEQNRAQEILAPYRNTISETPTLLSLLYDADMLPEQAVTIRGAISIVAVVVAYKAGLAQRDPALKAAMGALGDIADGEPEWPNDPQKELDWCRRRAMSVYRKARGG